MQNDFGKGAVWKVILAQSVPLMLAQLVHLLYNVVDRVFIGHMAEVGSLALTGVGLAVPIVALVAAFTNLYATGGAPLFAIARGEKDEEKAQRILCQVCGSLIVTSLILFAVCFCFRREILYLFGASDTSYAYADTYLKIYLFGTTAAMLSTGLNGFINASGYPRIGMYTILIGAAVNIILDPVFIYALHMGVAGAALATVISQLLSCIWAVGFFIGPTSPYRLELSRMKPDLSLQKDIVPLGIAGFVMQGTNALVQVVCNVMLRQYGGDLYVGTMTVINSIRDILQLPALCFTQGAQPVISYNYGSRQYSRIRSSILFMTLAAGAYTVFAWAAVFFFPQLMMSVFTSDAAMISVGVRALRIYFFGFVFMMFQSGGQSTFTAMRCTKRAIFFSLFRKVIIVVPLTLLLPGMGFGTDGVFLAEPISNFIGGLACFITMMLTVYRKLPADGEQAYI